ncbi:hypothetical protein HU200_061286 [Digitaria exilis]|uniref:Uncharacterized protein n=1 Tax=Digitaria exilis TaxID=1010633 RepID=A0A835E0V9_9POAL|nr:hypothetical protein HU200_061286 [Digitaria exilis]
MHHYNVRRQNFDIYLVYKKQDAGHSQSRLHNTSKMNSTQLLVSSAAAASPAISQSQWSSHQLMVMASSSQSNLGGSVLACTLSFLAAAISSAGGVGGGSLYVPILTVVAGIGLKTATAFSTFMVTGSTLSNVFYTVFFLRSGGDRRTPVIDYGIAVVSQPCLLLGVSAGVVCNVVFPEWLVTALFSLFLAFATFKTYGAGVRRWRAETPELGRIPEDAAAVEEEALLGENGGGGRRCQWVDLVVLVTVWLCFFVMHLFIGGEGAKGAFGIMPCGVAYWLITVAQIPVALAFTACIGHQRRKSQQAHQGAIADQTASATTMFMVLFCASMSMVQFIILGVEGIATALVYAAACLVASIVGLAAIEGAIRRSGRASLIVFMVAGVLALSAVVIACSGAVRVWEQYRSGQYMGFKMPC